MILKQNRFNPHLNRHRYQVDNKSEWLARSCPTPADRSQIAHTLQFVSDENPGICSRLIDSSICMMEPPILMVLRA